MNILSVLNTKVPGGRPIGDYFKVQRAVSWLVRDKKSFATPFVNGQYVDIGCGPNMRPDWYNIDWLWRIGVDHCLDVTNGLPFPDNSVAGYFSEHCFEHIPFGEFVKVAKEMHRTLAPGAWLRIVVPDAQIYCEKYAQSLNGSPVEMPYQAGDKERSGPDLYSPIFSLNRIMRDHGHLFIYDYAIMEKILLDAGFAEIQKMEFGKSNDPMLAQDMVERKVESLYVEARKPQ